MSPYQYRCIDKSILLPFLKKYVFSVIHRSIPYGVPANYLTLVSIIVIWSCFLYLIGVKTPDDADTIIVFFAITIYVIFDHLDGLQAKKLGRDLLLAKFQTIIVMSSTDPLSFIYFFEYSKSNLTGVFIQSFGQTLLHLP